MLLCAALSACSALSPQQRYGQSPDRSVFTFYKPVRDNFSADDPDDVGSYKTDGDPNIGGWSLQLDSSQSGLGWLIGYSQRKYGIKADATEFYGGGRYYLGGVQGSGYAIGLLRYSKGLDISGGPKSDSYYGYGAGLGVTQQMTDNIYLDFQALYNGQFGDIQFGNSDVDLRGVVFSVGIAIAQ